MRALVVDDHPELRRILVSTVEQRGHDVVDCCDAESAQERCAAEVFPLVLLDIGLPGMNGLDFCRWYRQQPGGEDSAVIVITGDLDPSALVEILEAGGDDYIPKPFRTDLLNVRLSIAERRAEQNRVRRKALDDLAESQRIRHEQEFRASEERYRSLVQHSVDIVTVIAPNGTRRYISPSAEWLLGYSPDELIGENTFEIVHPDDVAVISRAMETVVRDETAHPSISIRLRHRDGEYRDFEAIATNALGDPSINGVVFNSRDITERRRVEEALRESDERFRGSFDYAPIGMAIVDIDGVCVDVNRALCEMVGYSKLQLLSRRLATLMHGDDLADDRAGIERMLRGEVSTVRGERRYIHNCGATVWSLSNTSLVRDRTGRPSYFIAQILDISARKRTEAALANSESRTRAYMESALDAVVGMNHEGLITDFNPAAEAMLGYRRDEAIGQSLADLMVPASLREAHRQGLARYLATGVGPVLGQRIEINAVRKSGEEFPVELAISPVEIDGFPWFVAYLREITERLQMQTALERSEQRFRSLVQNSSDIVLVLDERSIVRSASPALTRVLGFAPDDVIGKSNVDLAHPEDVRLLQHAFLRAARSEGELIDLEVRFRHKNGSYRVLNILANNLLADPSVGGIVVNARDVTERAWSERADQLVKSIAIAIGDVPEVAAAVGIVVREICRATRWRIGELWWPARDGSRLELSHEWYGSHARARQWHEESRTVAMPRGRGLPGRAWETEAPVWIRDVREYPDFLRIEQASEFGLGAGLAVPIMVGGEVLAVASFFMDEPRDEDSRMVDIVSDTIRELDTLLSAKRADEKRRNSERRFRSMVQNGSDVISVFDRTFTRTYISPSVERVLGYKPDEVLSGKAALPIHPEDLPVTTFFEHLISEPHHTHTAEVRIQHSNGSWRWFDVIGANQLSDSAVNGLVINARDVTERKEAELGLAQALRVQQVANEQLTELNKAKSDFVSVVSHEFRTPLTSIQGFAELIQDSVLDPETTHEFSALIHGEALRLGRLISEMLDFDRMESGRVQLSFDPIEMDDVLDAIVRQIQPTMKMHQCVAAWDRPLPPLTGDHDKLIQVFTNLVNNAVKYSPKGGNVTIGGGKDGDRLHLWVKDEGIGIPADAIDLVFERYARVESGSNRRINGTGLGLAIVRQIVSMHGGEVWAESVIGQGSTFHVVLPLQRT